MEDWREAIDGYLGAAADRLRKVRRHLHAHPEASREEFQTARFLAEQLEGEGAREMIEAGALAGIGSIVALHVDPEVKVGRVAQRRGIVTAMCEEVHVT